jgi:hypothetical protein
VTMTKSISSLAAVVFVFVACGGDKREGLPPASEWKEPEPGAAPKVDKPKPVVGGGAAGQGGNPHAGTAMGGGDPHAGMGAAGMGGAPHAGMGGGAATGAGHASAGGGSVLARGKIVAGDAVKARITGPVVIFISARVVDPASGVAAGAPVAIAKLDGVTLPGAFELSGAAQAGGELEITAWTDGDGDAMSKQPGDNLGTLRIKVPAEAAEIKLDRVLE